jgi:2,3-dihydroxyphenylpropionate 1,2-dioxygenase
VLGVGASHSTLMNTHWEQTKDQRGASDFRDALAVAREAVAAACPDVVVIIGSNHFRGFWLDLIPAFTLGVGEVIASGESGTPKGPVQTDPVFAQRLAGSLMDAGTEVAISARLQIDHGQTHALQYLLPGLDVPVVPLVINVFAAPLPRLDRCVALGRNLAAAIAGAPGDQRVAVIASGGLSHRLPWPEHWYEPEGEDEEFLVQAWLNGRNDWASYDGRRREIITSAQSTIFSDFDLEFLDALDHGALQQYATLSTDDLNEVAGNGGQELRTWLTMAAALDFVPGRTVNYTAMPEWLTGMAVALVEPGTARV